MTDWKKIQRACDVVEAGIAKRVDIDENTVVYKAGTVLRIDLKNK